MTTIDIWTVMAAGFAGLAAALALRRPLAAGLHAATPHRRAPSRWRPQLRGRDDGLPLARRLLVGGAVGGAVGWWMLSVAPAAALLGPVLAGLVAVLLGHLEPQRVRRRRTELARATPQVLDLLSVCLAAGLPLRGAIRAVVEASDGPVAEDLGEVLTLVDLGVGDADAWRGLAEHPQLGAAAVELARSVESGTMMAESLAALAAEARASRIGEIEVSARGVGVRSVLPLMTCFIPAFLLLGVVPAVLSAVLNAMSG